MSSQQDPRARRTDQALPQQVQAQQVQQVQVQVQVQQ